jgi:hypothetical protein
MNIRLGVYEIFSRIVPGGLYLAAVGQLLHILGLYTFDLQTISELPLLLSIAILLGAYSIGGAMDRLAIVWFRLFAPRGTHGRVFESIRRQYGKRWHLDFTGEDWNLLLSHIRTRDFELAAELDRYNAVSIMLRNVSLALTLICFNLLFQSVQTASWTYALLALGLFLTAILLILESKKFREWYYDNIFRTALGYRIEMEELIRPVNEKKRAPTRPRKS